MNANVSLGDKVPNLGPIACLSKHDKDMLLPTEYMGLYSILGFPILGQIFSSLCKHSINHHTPDAPPPCSLGWEKLYPWCSWQHHPSRNLSGDNSGSKGLTRLQDDLTKRFLGTGIQFPYPLFLWLFSSWWDNGFPKQQSRGHSLCQSSILGAPWLQQWIW